MTDMNTHQPDTARERVLSYVRLETDGDPAIEARIVWFSYILGGWKALVMVDTNANYYEVTYNAEKDELYIDEYKKVNNKAYHDFYDGS